MARPELMGVSSSVRDSEVGILTDREQDEFLKTVAADLEVKLGKFVGGIRTHKARPIAFNVTGPHNDPIQGVIHVHTLVGWFDLDALPTECDAYRVHVMDAPGTTQGHQAPDTSHGG